MECNCSICRRKGFSQPVLFQLRTPREALTVYTWNQHIVRHQFCKVCGCAPFGEGTMPDGTAMVAVDMRCVKNADLSALKISPFDGASL